MTYRGMDSVSYLIDISILLTSISRHDPPALLLTHFDLELIQLQMINKAHLMYDVSFFQCSQWPITSSVCQKSGRYIGIKPSQQHYRNSMHFLQALVSSKISIYHTAAQMSVRLVHQASYSGCLTWYAANLLFNQEMKSCFSCQRWNCAFQQITISLRF